MLENQFNRKNLDIEDQWTYNQLKYKDSELVSIFRKNTGANPLVGAP